MTYYIVSQFEKIENSRTLEDRSQKIVESLRSVRDMVRNEIEKHLRTVVSLKTLVSVNPNPSKLEFFVFGEALLRDNPEIRSLTLLPDNVVSMVYPMKNNESAIGMDVTKHPIQKHDALEAIRSNSPQFSGPVELKQGGEGFIVRVPVYSYRSQEKYYWGLVSVVIDRDTLLTQIRKKIPASMLTAIYQKREDEDKLVMGDPDILKQNPESLDLRLNESNHWQIFAVPSTISTVAPRQMFFSFKILITIVAGILFGWSTSSLMHRVHISELLKKSNAELRETHKRLDLALTGANVGLWDWNVAGDSVYFSPTAKSQLGYDPNDEWNDFVDWEGRLHPDDLENAKKLVTDYFENPDEEYRSIFRLRCFNGSYRWILSQGIAQFGEDGKPIRMIGVHVDIDDRVRMEERIANERLRRQEELEKLAGQLQKSNDALEKSNVELQQFAYIASHDLQTPLRGIAGFAQCLQEEYYEQVDDQAREYIDLVVSGCERMKQLIDDLLSYSRIESSATRFEPLSLDSIVNDAEGLLRASIDESGAVITRDKLPEITADSAQMSQLLQNLIGNAIKYRGDASPEIHISATKEDSQVIIAVKDNGIGIDPAHHQKIFDIFRRLHTLQKYPGTGIGLAVCRRIVLRHGGRIWVESEPKKGSTFFVSIPDHPAQSETS